MLDSMAIVATRHEEFIKARLLQMKDQATKDKALKLRMSCVGYNLITNKTLRASNSAGMHPAFGVNA